MPYMPSGALVDLNFESLSDEDVSNSTSAHTITAAGLTVAGNGQAVTSKFAFDPSGRKCVEIVTTATPSGSGNSKRSGEVSVYGSDRPYVAEAPVTEFTIVHIPPLPSNVASARAYCWLFDGNAVMFADSTRKVGYAALQANNGAMPALGIMVDPASYERGAMVFSRVLANGETRAFLNGTLSNVYAGVKTSHEVWSAYAPAPAVGVRIYRVTGYGRAFSDAEVLATSEAILSHFDRAPQTVNWSAPEHDGGAPITGYEIHSIDEDGEVTRTKTMDPDAVDATFLAKPPVAVQVYALNKAGRSIPAEAEL